MPQLWKLVNLDKQYYPRVGNVLGFWNGLVRIDWLVRPIMPCQRIWVMSDRLVEIKLCPTTPPLLRLPAELILLILEELGDIFDMLMLCLAHDILGAHGEPLVYVRAAEIISSWSWAGDRLMHICNSTVDTDYPQAVQSLVNEAVARYIDVGYPAVKKYSRQAFWHCCEEEWMGDEPGDVGHSLWPGWDPRVELLAIRPEEGSLARLLWEFFQKDWLEHWTYVDRDARYFQTAKHAINRMYDYTRDGGLVICNISKAEYIRGDAVEKLNQLPEAESLRGFHKSFHLDLGHALSAYLCWSSDSTRGLTWPENRNVEEKLARGRWAGDRFEVVLSDQMQAGVEWKDVTGEAVEWLTEIMKATQVQRPHEDSDYYTE